MFLSVEYKVQCQLHPYSRQDNAIGDDGVIALTEALMRNGRLRTVCLDGNKVPTLFRLNFLLCLTNRTALGEFIW